MKSRQVRDKIITREIHRLFWQGNLQNKSALFISYVGRIPAVAAYNIFIPLFSAYAIQSIISRHFEQVTPYAWWIIGLSIAYCVLWTIGGIAVTKNAIEGSAYVQNKIFSNFLRKDYDFYTNAYFGSLGAQAAQIRTAFGSYGELVTLSIPKQLTIVIAGIGVIAYQSLLLALVTIGVMICVLSFTLWSSSWRLRFRRKTSEASNEIAAHVGDSLTHGVSVKSFAMENHEIQRLQKPLKEWKKQQFWSWLSALPAENGRMLLAGLATAILLVLSSRLYQEGTVTITVVVLIQLYVVKLVASTLDIAEMVKRYEEIMGQAYQPVKTMLIENTILDPEKPKRLKRAKHYTLELDHVSYRYPEAAANQQAVKDFTFTILPGERIGIVGHSGSGKTTLTELFLRFMDVTNGSIKIDGVDIRDLSQKSLRNVISYVPQEPLLFHRSIAENISYARPRSTKKKIEEAARLAYVNEFVDELPEGFNTAVGEHGIKLSGGQRQRVAIARAILKDSPILVLDEATSALDSKSEHFIQEALWKLLKERSALVVAHRLSTIQRMDKIIVMDKGRIAQIGTHETLKSEPGIYANLWKHQSGGYIGTTVNDSK
jgi:ATP-binding cassette subfamily B protein